MHGRVPGAEARPGVGQIRPDPKRTVAVAPHLGIGQGDQFVAVDEQPGPPGRPQEQFVPARRKGDPGGEAYEVGATMIEAFAAGTVVRRHAEEAKGRRVDAAQGLLQLDRPLGRAGVGLEAFDEDAAVGNEFGIQETFLVEGLVGILEPVDGVTVEGDGGDRPLQGAGGQASEGGSNPHLVVVDDGRPGGGATEVPRSLGRFSIDPGAHALRSSEFVTDCKMVPALSGPEAAL